MKYIVSILVLGIILPGHSFASIQAFLGVNKALHDVQDKNGKEARNPFSPALSVGTNFRLSQNYGFSPQLGYIHNTNASDDSYGEYKVRTFFLLYDFIWIPEGFNDLALRFGLGTFMKKIKGEGGSVTIPNGNGTAKAYRPSGTETSYSSTVNLGLDYNFNYQTSYFENLGLRLEFFTYRILSKENRNYAYNFGAIFYF